MGQVRKTFSTPAAPHEGQQVDFVGFVPDEQLRRFVAQKVEELLDRVPLGSQCKLVVQQEREKLNLRMNFLLDTLWGPVAHKVVNVPVKNLKDCFDQVKEKIGLCRSALLIDH